MSNGTFVQAVGAGAPAQSQGDSPDVSEFRRSHPILALGLFGTEHGGEGAGAVEVGVKNFGGRLQARVAIPSEETWAYVAIERPVAFLSELEAALREGMVQWQRAKPKEKRKA